MWGWLDAVLKFLHPWVEKGIAFLSGWMLGKGQSRIDELEADKKASDTRDELSREINQLDDSALDDRLGKWVRRD